MAALSSVLSCRDLESLAQHPIVRSFIRGTTNLMPPAGHRYPTWELPKVLQAFSSVPFKPLRSASLRLLTCKLAFLVVITSVRHIAELAALSVREDLCVFHPNRMVLRLDPSFLPKINSLFHRAQELILPDFCPAPTHTLENKWHTLDVSRGLCVYI